VGGGALAIEQAGGRKNEGSGTNGDQTCAASVRRTQCFKERFRRRFAGSLPARNNAGRVNSNGGVLALPQQDGKSDAGHMTWDRHSAEIDPSCDGLAANLFSRSHFAGRLWAVVVWLITVHTGRKLD
jgi:hypothetical protein